MPMLSAFYYDFQFLFNVP